MMSDMIFLDHRAEEHKKNFLLDWYLENPYNLKMKAGSSSGSPTEPDVGRYLDVRVISEFCDRVLCHYADKLRRKVIFEFSGGELTPVRYLLQILGYLKNRACKRSLVVNHARKQPYWKKLIDEVDFVTLTYPSGYNQPEAYIALMEYLQNHTILRAAIVMQKERFAECRDLAQTIMRSFQNVMLSILPPEEEKYLTYSGEKRERLSALLDLCRAHNEKNGLTNKWYRGEMTAYTTDGGTGHLTPEQILAHRQNNWKSWMCWSGLHKMVVAPDGDVYRAWCFNERLGNVGGDVTFPTVPISCPLKRCADIRDIALKRQSLVLFNPGNIRELAEIGIF